VLSLAEIEAHMTDEVAALMITNPNTLGLFETNIEAICQLVHQRGGWFTATAPISTPCSASPAPATWDRCDALQPAQDLRDPPRRRRPRGRTSRGQRRAGAVPPGPRVVHSDGHYRLAGDPASIGRLVAFHGNFGIMLRAYAYIRSMGAHGLKHATEMAVLNANYVRARLEEASTSLIPTAPCMRWSSPTETSPTTATLWTWPSA